MIRQLGLNQVSWAPILWAGLWLIGAGWEQSLGWPVLTLLGLILVATGPGSTVRKVILTAIGILLVSGWYGLPVTTLIVFLILSFYLSSLSRRYAVTFWLALSGAVIVNWWRPAPVDGVVIGYLVGLFLVISGLTFRLNHWRFLR